MDNTPKFIQIATGQWKGSNGDFNHTVYGLTVEGKVYKFFVNEGWTLLRGRNEPTKRSEQPVSMPRREFREPIIDDDVPF